MISLSGCIDIEGCQMVSNRVAASSQDIYDTIHARHGRTKWLSIDMHDTDYYSDSALLVVRGYHGHADADSSREHQATS
jgi:hypothetical protein